MQCTWLAYMAKHTTNFIPFPFHKSTLTLAHVIRLENFNYLILKVTITLTEGETVRG